MRESEERKHISPSHSRPDEDAKANNQLSSPASIFSLASLAKALRGNYPHPHPHLAFGGLHTLQPLAIVYSVRTHPCRLPPSFPFSSLFFHVLLIPLENVELCGNEIPFVDRGFEGGRERERACAPGAKTGARACLPTPPLLPDPRWSVGRLY